jgi:aminopeptidase N
MRRFRSFIARATFAVALPLAVTAGSAQAAPQAPSPGAAEIGDVLFPGLGNGGYDAEHYNLDLTYPTAEPAQTVDGKVTMIARATQALSRFDLDFSGTGVSAVSVNGAPAAFSRSGDELVITPRRALRDRSRFVTQVDFTSGPTPPAPGDPFPFGWFTTNDGSVTAGQPNFAHVIYPVNDHPADKASYTFRVDVPQGTTAVANGVKLWSRTRGGRTESYFLQRQPMASELVQVAVGALSVIDRGSVNGTAVRDVAPTAQAPALETALARTPDHLRWMEGKVGPYPFDTYGVLAADQQFFYALETQTLSLHPSFLLDVSQVPLEGSEPILVHELAHQWFGDSVAPYRWQDVWLNEGHADWYQREYDDEVFGVSMEDYMRDAYRRANQLRADFGPVAKPTGNDIFTLFSDNVYSGGSLVLYALRQVIGDPAFRAVERGWAQREAGRSVTTEDFIAFASQVAHRDLGDFLRAWLYGDTVPEMPGHPDWTADPVGAPAPAAKAAPAPSVQALEHPASTAQLVRP